MESKLEKLCDHCPEPYHNFHWDYSTAEASSLTFGNPSFPLTSTFSAYPSSLPSSAYNSPIYHQIPSFAQHTSSSTKLHAALLNKVAEDRCAALDLIAKSYPDILKRDYEHIMRLSFLVDKVRRLVESAVVSISRTKEEAGILTTNLMKRITFHVKVALKGLQESYDSGFVAPFVEVGRRSLRPLTSKIYEIASQLERTVKQLKFASPTDSVARKVLYHMADNQLSGKLETAIQVMDNFTKVYQAFQNSAPMLEQLEGFRVYHLPQGKASPLLKSHTPEGRYDIHLVPYALLARVQQKDLSRFYKGITENTARLIEHVMALKVTLKDVYQDSHFNETGFEAARIGFIMKSSEIEHYEALFEKEIVEEIRQQLVNRSNHLIRLNVSLDSTAGKLQNSLTDLNYLLRTRFSESNSGLIAFAQLSQQYLKDPEMKRSELFSLENEKSVRASLSVLSEIFHEAKSAGSKRIASLSSELNSLMEKSWQAMLNDSLLRNFYTNIYNDINDMLSRPQQSQLKRILLEMLTGLYGQDVLKRLQLQLQQQQQQQQTRHYHQQNSLLLGELYAFLNADLPTLSPEHKKAESSEIFARLVESTDIVKLLAGNDADLFQAFRHFRESVASTQASCQRDDQSLRSRHKRQQLHRVTSPDTIFLFTHQKTLNENLPRENFIFVDINIRTAGYSSSFFPPPSSSLTSSYTPKSRHSRIGHPEYEARPWSTYIAHAGGLLAFFTGGSLITIFQILSIILRSPCRCIRKCSGGQKKESAEVRKCGLGNHILLNPNDVNDEGIVANSSSTRSITNNSQLQTHPFRASKGTSSPPHQHRLQGYSTLPTSLGSITAKTPAANNLAACQRNAKQQTCSPRTKSDCNSSKQKPQCAKKSPIDRFYKQAETDI